MSEARPLRRRAKLAIVFMALRRKLLPSPQAPMNACRKLRRLAPSYFPFTDYCFFSRWIRTNPVLQDGQRGLWCHFSARMPLVAHDLTMLVCGVLPENGLPGRRVGPPEGPLREGEV